MKIFFLAFVSLTVFCQIAFAQNDSSTGFAVYLLPEDITPNQLKNLDLKKLKPIGKPFIAENDIQFYQKETHAFRIGYLAAERLKKINDGKSGRTFAVFVGNEAIYAGAFWKSISSQSFDGIIIDPFKSVGKPPYYSNSDYPILTLELGYPSPAYFKSIDLRADSRIFKALENTGKLYEKLELVVKCKKITASGKRRPSSYFEFEIVTVTKGEFKDKEIQFELFDGKLLPELDAELGWGAGENVEFNPDREIVLEMSKQVGKEKPKWFLIDYRKK